ncbi:helix-turn-helix domain-containing protein [Thermosediminibacter oceani]|uniref:Cupin 2 conserved barrel domain protein n=1 Tax=Thermosediminibacter oceani (strain ATCC BAA-1034 / DSM 16646 / JW/IW-1228P) TaxID=555079 RepID=D9RZA7_THEOJ|nr:XRE family transcriptional regulator [Thermosediminibacter oceani]ADL08661.1 Cupin 2 conserved barrel domain protein [Thermosediminibacter oceani DSM 16646]
MINEIAEKISKLRKQKGLTLKELSEMTGLSVSFLSQVENGYSSLAITSLKKIADALNVPITEFFSSYHNHSYHIKLSEQKVFKIEGNSAEYVLLSGEFPKRTLEAMIVYIQPGEGLGSKFSHPGEEFVYVLEGAVIVDIDGKEYLVKAGESIHYPSTIPHSWFNPLERKTKLLTVLTPIIF